MKFSLIDGKSPDSFDDLASLFRQNTNACDGLRLTPVDVTSRLFQDLKTKRSRDFLVHQFRPPEPTPILDFPATFDEFMARRNSLTRKTIRRQFRLLEKNYGPLEWRSYETPDEVDDFLREAVPVADSSWQAKDGLGSLTGSEMSRQRYREWASAGELFAYILKPSAGGALAFWMGQIRGSTFHSKFIGYDPAHSAAGPAKLLIYKAVELEMTRADSRFTRVNWGRGEQPYKLTFSTHIGVFAEFWLLKRSLRNALWAHSQTARRVLVELIKQNKTILKLKRRFIAMPDRRPGAIDHARATSDEGNEKG